MRGAQDHTRCFFCLKRFLPARCTQAPPVTGLQPWKAEFWNGSRKIVTARFGKLEKRRGHDRAYRVAADVLSPGIAAAVAKETGHGI